MRAIITYEEEQQMGTSSHIPQQLTGIPLSFALESLADSQWFTIPYQPRAGGGVIVVAGMGSWYFGTDIQKVREHNLSRAEMEPKAEILIANYRIEADPEKKRLPYLRECRISLSVEAAEQELCGRSLSQSLVNMLNITESCPYTWQQRRELRHEHDLFDFMEEHYWIVVYAGDPHHPCPTHGKHHFAQAGGREKTEHLVRCLVKCFQSTDP